MARKVADSDFDPFPAAAPPAEPIVPRARCPDSPAAQPPGRRYRAPARLVGAQAKIEKKRSAIILTAATLIMCCLMFPSVGWGWLGYSCFVPWLVCVCTVRSARFMYLLSWLLGVGYFFINIRWMLPVTLEGYIAMNIYYSLAFPLAAWPIRHMYQRHGISVAISAPIVWTAIEYLRSIGPLGFPWLLLGHTQYKFLTIIQISDLVGAYGVSFILAMINGWLTDLLIQPILIWRTDEGTRVPIGSLTLFVVLAGTLAYGSTRNSAASFESGPRVALIQHDFPMYVDTKRASRTSSDMVFRAYFQLAQEAALLKPDIIVLPETAMHGYINDEFIEATTTELDEIQNRRLPKNYPRGFMASIQRESRQVRDAFQQLSTSTRIPIVLGSSAIEWKPTALPPRAEAYNSAFLLLPNSARPAARYDKNHLVIFGEYVPFRFSYPWLYEWLNSITPWGAMGLEYSLGSGSGYHVFEFPAVSKNGRVYRAGTPICYEEIMPYIARTFTLGSGPSRGEKNTDMLFTISNDGWFLHSAELEQHLAAAVFRAVENRIAIARSVNTGASAAIWPNGEIVDRVVLAPQKIPLLSAAVKSLEKIKALVDRMGPLVNDANAFRDKLPELSQAISNDYRAALQAVGPAFTISAEQLSRQVPILVAGTPEGRAIAATEFRKQIEDEQSTLARWQSRPHTAPGYSIAEMKCDRQLTVYTRWGDWFVQGTVALTIMMLLDWLLRRVSRRRGSILRGMAR